MENTKMKLTGKPSIDKPWLQFYPEAAAQRRSSEDDNRGISEI